MTQNPRVTFQRCMVNGLLLFGFGLVLYPWTVRAASDGQPKAVVFVSQIKSSELFDLLTYPARVVPSVNATLLAETDGVVSKITAPLGQKVSAGQSVLTITHTDPVYQFAPAKVRSPVAGVVSVLEVTEGTQVSKGQKIGAVTDPGSVRISVEVPAADVGYLKKGMNGEFSIPERQEVRAVRVRGVSPFVDPATGTASCELEFVNAKEKVVPGLIGKVSFKANLRRGITIPDSAVNYKGAETFVRLVENNQAKKVPVRLGNRQQGFVEVLTGLRENMQLVERASKHLADGEPVIVQSEEGKPGTVVQ